MRIKICGITNTEDAQLCSSLGADALGFIFYEKSKRFIDPESAKKIISSLPFFVMKVGVFVDADPENVNTIAREIGLNAVQLHGNETPEYVQQINYPVIKSFRVSEGFDYSVVDKYEGCGILLDTFSQQEYGGTGKSFNWETIPENLKNRIILSGGVSIENIEVVFNKIKPEAVDLSSSLELHPGKKDKNKVMDFFAKYNLIRVA